MIVGGLFDDPSVKSDEELLQAVDLLKYPHCHVATSANAASEQDPIKTSAQYLAILGVLRRHEEGLTRWQINQLTGIEDFTVNARIGSLSKSLLVFKTNDRRVGRASKPVEVICHLYNRTNHKTTKPFEQKFISIKVYNEALEKINELEFEIRRLRDQ